MTIQSMMTGTEITRDEAVEILRLNELPTLFLPVWGFIELNNGTRLYGFRGRRSWTFEVTADVYPVEQMSEALRSEFANA